MNKIKISDSISIRVDENTREVAVMQDINGETSIINLSERNISDIIKAVDISLYYKEDVVTYYKSYKINLPPKKILNAVIIAYADLRKENDGGDSDNYLNWEECVEKAISDIYDNFNYKI